MLSEQQLEALKTSQECADETEKRLKLLEQLSGGWLYTSIIESELAQLYARGLTLLSEERNKRVLS